VANTSSHPITVNGTRLDTWAYNIQTKNGWVTIPNYRSGNIVVPGKQGELWTPGKRREPGSMVLSMWIRNTDVDDVQSGTDQYYNWRKNLDTILRLFNSPYALLDIQQTMTSGTIRRAYCEVKGISDPSMRTDHYGELKISLDIPNAFWEDLTTTEYAPTDGAGVVTTHNLTAFQDATAPMEDLEFYVRGPIVNPRITDPNSGHYVQLNYNLTLNEDWSVNTTAWTTRTGSVITYTTTGGVNRIAETVAVGPMLPRLFGLAPGSPPRVQLSGTGAGGTTRLRVRTKRQYL
jgi:hypothetical protein